MRNAPAFALVLCVLAIGCAHVPPAPDSMSEASLELPTPPPVTAPAASAKPLDGQTLAAPKAAPAKPEKSERIKRAVRPAIPTPPASGAAALAAANGAARQKPVADRFEAARQNFIYKPGALYELIANPAFVSTLLLEPGETLIDIAAGDTARWMVSEAIGETQITPRTIVLIKPHAAPSRTNIVLITDRRTYLIEAVAQAGATYAAQTAWVYPRDEAGAARGGVDVARLNFAYRVASVKGRKPVWAPTRIYDDGKRTYIAFAADVHAADLPPLFVLTGEGPELVNYRVEHRKSGPLYVVDRLFERAELRLGAKKPVIVRITRETGPGA